MAKAKPVPVVELSALLAGEPEAVALVEAALAAKGLDSYAEWQRALTLPVGAPDLQSLRRLGAHSGFDVKE